MSRWGCGFLAASDHIRHLHDCGRKFSISPGPTSLATFDSVCFNLPKKQEKRVIHWLIHFTKKAALQTPWRCSWPASEASGMPSWNRSSLKNPSWRTDQKSNPCHIPHQTPATWRVTMDSGPGIFRKRNKEHHWENDGWKLQKDHPQLYNIHIYILFV